METGTDRRVRRTRGLLHRALIALILEKGYRRITVQDILDQADLGRSTFYAHYRSKDELLLASVHEHLGEMFGDVSASAAEKAADPLFQPVFQLIRLVDSNRHLYRAMIGEQGSDLIIRSFRKLLSQIMTEHLRARLLVEDERWLASLVAFLVSGLIGLVTWWLDSEVSFSAAEIYASFEHLATQGLGSHLVHHQEHPPVR